MSVMLLFWFFNANGLYSVQSLYDVVSFRVVMPLHTDMTPAVR